MASLPPTLTHVQRANLLAYAERSLRNQADRDYITARLCYRAALLPQFLWNSLQALEKYLEGILVFSYRPAKYRHDVAAALAAVEAVPEIDLDLPDRVRQFIDLVSRFGENRYLDRAFYLRGSELFDLDWSVWYVRRYCQNLFLIPGPEDDPREAVRRATLNVIRCATERAPHHFRVSRGLLEKILRDGPDETRSALVYKNPCYGRMHRRHLRNYRTTSMSENPVHVLHPEILPILEQLVQLPPERRRRSKQRRPDKSSRGPNRRDGCRG